MSDSNAVESLEQQLVALYQERELLEEKFGASSADDIANMVESLEAQLRDFYERYGGTADQGDNSALILSKLHDLSSQLDPMYSQKSVEFTIENDKPVLRATWSEAISQGD